MLSNTKSYFWFISLYIGGIIGVGCIHYTFKYLALGLVMLSKVLIT